MAKSTATPESPAPLPTPTDELAVFRERRFAEQIDQLTELLSQGRRAFVIGAGCSKCAGLPLMAELTQKVLGKLDKGGKAHAILEALKNNFNGSKDCTIEDYMSELVDHIAIAERRNLRSATTASATIGATAYSLDDLANSLAEIKNVIAAVIGQPESGISDHRRFVRAVHRVLQAGKASQAARVDYYTLNYDTLFEDALSLERIPTVDGFMGGATGWWAAGAYEGDTAEARVLKIHGSIDWCLCNGETLPRRLRRGLKIDERSEPVLIWPASTKYRAAQRDPFAQIIGVMREGLRPASNAQLVLTICGYSFGDAHVNVELDRALHESDGRLTIIAFTDDDEPTGQLKIWRDDAAVQDQVRIHTNRGFFHGATEERSNADLPWWRFEVLARLLGAQR